LRYCKNFNATTGILTPKENQKMDNLTDKRIEAESAKATIKKLFENVPSEFEVNQQTTLLIQKMMLGIDSFDFFYPRKNMVCAEKEIDLALNCYAELMK
jgi:hypothetical protein